MGIYKYEFTISSEHEKKVVQELDSISLQNIENTHFTIDPTDISQQTYVELCRYGSMTDLDIRTKRAPNERGLNLELSLQNILKDVGARRISRTSPSSFTPLGSYSIRH